MNQAPAISDAVLIKEVKTHAAEASAAIKKSCTHAILAGMRLYVLWMRTKATNRGEHSDAGFAGALEDIGLDRRTAYRWVNAWANLSKRLDMALDKGDVMPEPGTKEWAALEARAKDECQTMSLRRLMLGSAGEGDENRYDAIVTKAESSEDMTAVDEALTKVSCGEWTLVQAIRAIAGQEATKGKERKDPLYLDMDAATGEVRGLLPKAVATLATGFHRWGDLDPTARNKFRAAWRELVAHLPKDL